MPDPKPSEFEILHQRMDLLARINGQLLERIGRLEHRLARLEGVPEPQAAPPAPAPLPRPEPVEAPLEFLPNEPPPEPPPAPAPEPEPDTNWLPPPPIPSAETSFGLNWLNKIGAFTLILAAAFFFRYAVDNGWIGPTGRVLLGLLSGFVLLAAAHFLRDRGHALFTQGLAGAGVAIFYLSFWASSSLYHLIPVTAAFAALVAVTALAGALAYRTRSLALATLGLLGAYITPPALSTGEYHPWILFTYLLLINFAWLAFARRMGWELLEILALAATIVLGGGMFDALERHGDLGPAGTYLLLGQYAVFLLTPVQAVLHVVQLIAGVFLAAVWQGNPLGFTVSSAVLLAVGMVAAHRRTMSALALTAASSCAAGFLFTRLAYDPSATLFLGAIAAFAVAHAFLPFRLSRGIPLGRVELSLQPLNAVAMFAAGYDYLSHGHNEWLGLFAALLGAVYLVTGLLIRRRLAPSTALSNAVLLSAGAALALFTAAIPLQFDSFRITVAWAFEAAAVAWIARRLDSTHARLSALAICLLTAVRLAFIDSTILPDPAAYSLLMNTRFVTFVLAAAGFALAAWWLRPNPLALPPYVTAHAILLSGLALEVSAQARRMTETDAFSAQMVSLSILMAAYGLALVAAGVGTRTRLNRVMGLSLLAMVIVKLYAVDVWTMDRVYRIVAFSALGILLLATSFLYSRFRAKIEALLQDENL